MLTGPGEEGDRIRFENVSLRLEEQPQCQQERTFPPFMDLVTVPISFIASSQYYPGPTVERRRF